MLALALALTLAAAERGAAEPPDAAVTPAVTLAPSMPTAVPLSPRLERGPFGAEELFGAAGGIALGDLAIAAAGWATLKLFANDTISPNANNFRRTAYAFGLAALLVPPLTATLFGNWASPGPRGGLFRAWLIGIAAQAASAFAGIVAAPHYWVVLPVQLITVTVGTSLGLHWGQRPPSAEDAAPPAPAAPAPVVMRAPAGTCPIG
jgi:hypothetical protein